MPGVYGSDETHLTQPSAVVTRQMATSSSQTATIPRLRTRVSLNTTVAANSSKPGVPAAPIPPRCWTATMRWQWIRMGISLSVIVATIGSRSSTSKGICWRNGTQFGKPSGLYIDKNDILYSADSKMSVRQHNAYVRGVHIGSAETGVVTAFIPDPLGNPAPWNPLRGTTGSEGVAVDKDGIIYTSQVTPPGLAKYTLKK